MKWEEFEAQEPELAGSVKACFERYQHAVLATLRKDGSPRLSGIEAPIRDGHLWLATAPTSQIAQDLRRDGRFALHSSLDSDQLPQGDAKIEGIAQPATAEQAATFIAGHRFDIDNLDTVAVFTTDLHRPVLTRVGDDKLCIDTWVPTTGHQVHYRT